MAVEYIKYKGEQLPVQVGYYALKNLQKHSKGKGIGALQEDLSLYEPLLYYSLKMGAIEEGIPFNWKLTDMEHILEHCLFSGFMEIVGGAFTGKEEVEKQKEVGMGKPRKTTVKKTK